MPSLPKCDNGHEFKEMLAPPVFAPRCCIYCGEPEHVVVDLNKSQDITANISVTLPSPVIKNG